MLLKLLLLFNTQPTCALKACLAASTLDERKQSAFPGWPMHFLSRIAQTSSRRHLNMLEAR